MSEPVHTLIASDPVAGKTFLDDILQKLRDQKCQEYTVFCVHLSVEEALVNAIRHGNAMDQTKHVQIRHRLSEDQLWIEITDEGVGFDPAAVPDCTDPENLEKPSGRGLKLMRNFMTDVIYNEIGNSVTLVKKLT